LDAWAVEVSTANALDDVLVKVVANGSKEEVRVFHPRLQFSSIARDMLQGLLVDVCDGLYRGCMVADFIQPSRSCTS
jgi:hypothetical protein